MNLYIAGPMTGRPHYNAAAFEEARVRWTNLGHDVVTPFDANSIVWRKHYARDFNPHIDVCDWGDPILPEMLAEDLRVLCEADGVVLLEGWERSKGATSELLIACNLGKAIFLDATQQQTAFTPTLTFAPLALPEAA